MRRFFLMCAATALVPWLNAMALAQLHHNRSGGVANDPPSVNHISLHGSSSAAGSHQPVQVHPRFPVAARVVPNPAAAAPAQAAAQTASASRQNFSAGYQHHHHGHFSNYSNAANYSNATIWLYGATAYPYYWTSAYTPAFASYYPIYPYYSPNYWLSTAPVGMGAFNMNVPNANVPNVNAANVNVNMPVAEPRNLDPVPRPDPPKPKVRASTAEQKAKAGKLIATGDANFGRQQYFPALERYKSAAQLAPDAAEPFLRQAYAMVAVGQYEKAAQAYRRALKIRGDWNGSPFRLDQLYGDTQIAKDSHFENLAKALETNPLDSNLLVNLGLQLFFDGQRDRGLVFLTRAAQFGGNADHLLDSFLAAGAGDKPQPNDDAQEAKIVF